MDNRIISIQSEGRHDFNLGFQLMFGKSAKLKATHYFEHPSKGFILLWNEYKWRFEQPTGISNILSASKLPYAMGWEAASDLAWGWLQEREEDEYQEYLDHDGSDGKGFRIYNEQWGHVADCSYAILGLIPVHAWYGK